MNEPLLQILSKIVLLVTLVVYASTFETAPSDSSEEITCNKTTRKCRCPDDPLTEKYRDPSDPTCRNYFLCHLGRAFQRSCEVRTAFHPTKRECMSRKQIPEYVCPFPVECGLINGYMADPEDCTKYYLCFFQQPFHYGCKDGEVFDDKKKQCIRNRSKADHCAKPKFRNVDHDSLRQ